MFINVWQYYGNAMHSVKLVLDSLRLPNGRCGPVASVASVGNVASVASVSGVTCMRDMCV